MKLFAYAALTCLVLAPSIGLAQAKRESGKTVVTGCVASITHGFHEGTLSTRVQVAGLPVLVFHASGLKVGAAQGRLTPAQINQWTQVVDSFREAARMKVKVTVSYEKDDREVDEIHVQYGQPC
jgi:hypothetical protein